MVLSWKKISLPAGFPIPADDFAEKNLDLNKILVSRPAATFFVRVSGHSMQKAGIFDGDILVVDRSLNPKNGQVIVACIDGEFTIKHYYKKGKQVILKPNSSDLDYKDLIIEPDQEFEVWGVGVYVIHALNPS